LDYKSFAMPSSMLLFSLPSSARIVKIELVSTFFLFPFVVAALRVIGLALSLHISKHLSKKTCKISSKHTTVHSSDTLTFLSLVD